MTVLSVRDATTPKHRAFKFIVANAKADPHRFEELSEWLATEQTRHPVVEFKGVPLLKDVFYIVRFSRKSQSTFATLFKLFWCGNDPQP